MEALPRPSGPIGANAVFPRPAPRSGMIVTPPKAVNAPAEPFDLHGIFRAESFPNKAVIYAPGDALDRSFIVKSGRVRLMRYRPHAGRSVTDFLRPGDFFGDLFGAEAQTAEDFAVAAGDAEVWVLDRRDFRMQLQMRPQLALQVLETYAGRTRSLQRRVIGLTFKEVPARLADTIVTLAETHGERCPHGGELDLRGITQQDLADLVGASRSFVSTLINEMKRDGLLGNVGRVLCVKDQRALRKAAQS